MKLKTLALAAIAALALGACSHKSATVTEEQPAENVLLGSWNIENVVVNDSLGLCLADVDSLGTQTVNFAADSSYVINTNCNTIQGAYILDGDSLSFEPGLMTEMACDNMQVEELLRVLLPELKTYTLENDSTLRLNSDREGYVVLKK